MVIYSLKSKLNNSGEMMRINRLAAAVLLVLALCLTAGVQPVMAEETSNDITADGSSECIKYAEDLKAGKPSVIELSGTVITEMSITPADNIPKLRVTVQNMDSPDEGMGVPQDGIVQHYVKAALEYTTPETLSEVTYTAKISKEWLDSNNSSLLAAWYYNEPEGTWERAEIINAAGEDGYSLAVFKPEMPGFGWFAVGGLPVELILGNDTLPLGPEPVIPSEIPEETLPFGPGPEITSGIPEETLNPESTRAESTATPLPVVTVISGVFFAAGILLHRKKY